MYDYIIVGAGLYGRMLAYKLSLQKNKILLIDKKDIFKKNKLNYILITKCDIENLNHLIEEDISKYIIKKPLYLHIIDTNKDVERYLLDLKKFENSLLEKYQKNKGKLLNKVNIDKYDFKNNQLIIRDKRYRYKSLVGADGTMSEVRLNLTNKIQKFVIGLQIKDKKINNDFTINLSSKTKVYEEIMSIRTNNYLKVVLNRTKSNSFNTIYKIKEKFNIKSENTNCYFIPTGDLLLQRGNIYFIGDAAGIIDNISYKTMTYNLTLINNFQNYEKKEVKKISREIKLKLFLSKFLYFKFTKRIIFKIISKLYKEDLWF